MKAVILAAGRGTRLWPLSESSPKVLTPASNRPIIDYVVEALVKNDVRDIAVVVGHQKEAVISHLGDGSKLGARISYFLQERPLGTAHALVSALPFLDEPFLVTPGDNFFDAHLVKDAMEADADNVIMLSRSDKPSNYGVVSQEGCRVVEIDEKPQDSRSNVISTGVYRLQPDVAKIIHEEVERGEHSLSSALNRNLSRLDLQGVMAKGIWQDAVYPWDLLPLNRAAMSIRGQTQLGNLEEGVVLRGPVQIGRGSRIRAGCYIEGPVVIGEGCEIGPYVSIFPHTVLGNEVQVDPYTLISGSVAHGAVRIGSHCHISRSILGRNTSVGPGCYLASGPATIVRDDKIIHRDDIGGIIGPDTSIGAGVSLRPGVQVGSSCKVLAGAVLKDNLSSNTEAV